MDPMTNDRRSCLPAHFVILMQLYHGMDNYVWKHADTQDHKQMQQWITTHNLP